MDDDTTRKGVIAFGLAGVLVVLAILMFVFVL
jgi:hypothetical protein